MFGIAITVITALCHWDSAYPDVRTGIIAIVGVDYINPVWGPQLYRLVITDIY